MTRWCFEHALLPEGWAKNVAITAEDGRITAVDTGVQDKCAGLALPGLPNLHSHTFQRGMAGLAERRGDTQDSFWTWRQVMYRFLDKLTPDDIEAIACFAFMEMLERGFTAVAEFHYMHHDPEGRPYDDLAELSGRIVAAAAETGIGLTLLPSLYSYSGFGGIAPEHGQRRFANDPDRFARLLDGARAHAKILPDAVVGVAPHSLRATDRAGLETARSLAEGAPIHLHIAEQVKEVDDCRTWSGRRPVEYLFDHVAVDGQWCLIHSTHMTEAETDRVATSGAVVGLCPITEASLGDGIFPALRYQKANGRFGVGSDSNIAIGAPEELRQLEYSQRLKERGRNLLARSASQSTGRSLYDASLSGGAQALGRPIGALRPGARADIVVLDPAHPGLAATGGGDQWLDAYVFAEGSRLVDTVIAGGVELVAGGRHRARDAVTAAYVEVLRRVASA